MKNCATCHSPNVPNGHRKPFCSFGCFQLDSFRGKFQVASLISLVISLVLFFLSIIFAHYAAFLTGFSPFELYWIRFSLAVVLLFILGIPIVRFLWTCSLHSGRFFHPEILLLTAIVLDFTYSLVRMNTFIVGESFESHQIRPFYFSCLLLLIHYLLALFEAYSRRQALTDFKSLQDLSPKLAHCRVNNELKEVLTQDLRVGDRLVIYEGEVLPCDGEIVKGATTVDETRLIGEPRLEFKKIGDQVLGGSLNQGAEIEIILREPRDKHVLERILGRIQEAYLDTHTHQKLMDYSFMGVLLVLLIYINSPYFISASVFGGALLTNTLAIFSIFILFNLLRIVPMLSALGIGRCSIFGILISDPKTFKLLSQLQVLVLNKTGVLTDGHYGCSNWHVQKGVNQGEMLAVLFSLQEHSTHPLAKGMRSHPWFLELPRYEVKDFKEYAGLGVSGKVYTTRDRFVHGAVGTIRFMKRNQVFIPREVKQRIDELETLGETALIIAWQREAKGIVSLNDTLRPDLQKFLREAVKLGLKPTLVTGDHEQMLTNLNYTHGLDKMYSRCLPNEKKRKIEKEREGPVNVGFVGDTLEEDAVVSAANVGMIFGTGTRILNKPAHVYFLGTRLQSITGLITFAKKLRRTVHFTVICGILYTLTAIVMSVTGFLSPAAILLLMAIGSILLMTNALRLKFFRLQDEYH